MKPVPAAWAAISLAFGLASCATAPADNRLYTAQGDLCAADAEPTYFDGWRYKGCNTKATWNMLKSTAMDASWASSRWGSGPGPQFPSETVSP